MINKLKVTPEEVRKVIKWQYSVIEHVDACLRIKKTCPPDQLPTVIAALKEEELIEIAIGANKVLDNLLFKNHCYNGYDTLGEKKIVKASSKEIRELRIFVGKGHPEFAEWRRKYHTRDVAMD